MVKRVLVVNDIPGAGKVAANVNIPILSAGRLEVSILPTMVISTQTGESYTEIVRHEFGTNFKAFMDIWEKNDIHFDVVMTGYFSTVEQVEEFRQYYTREKQLNPDMILIMDPIMADHGKFYPGFDNQIAQKFAGLMQLADIIFPNITEACFITDTPYSENFTVDELSNIGEKLIEFGVKYSVITRSTF
ncbi:bifunctional hydroxymethylpyrimidine kinase/phosphomethylpyrimidine kinase [Aerococcaceae bacterium WGS1372]